MKIAYKSLILSLAAIAAALTISGCGKKATEASAAAEEEKVANLVYVNWAEGVAYTSRPWQSF